MTSGTVISKQKSTTQKDNELKDTSYELFILSLSILSILNIILDWIIQDPDVEQVIFTMDFLLGFIFLGDFLYRFFTAESKRRYFFNQLGWLDLIGGLPLPRAKIARVARIIRAGRLMRRFGLANMVQEFVSNRAESAVYMLALLIILMLEFGSISILFAERGAPEANIETAADAIWWSFVTVSTVGYGDFYPTTNQGRFVAIFVILIGVGLFGVVTGFLANAFLPEEDEQSEEETQMDVILIELQKLQQAHEQTNEVLNNRLATIEALLDGQQKS